MKPVVLKLLRHPPFLLPSIALLAACGICHASLRVEVVDDTGAVHSPFLLLVGKKAGTPSPGTLSVNAGTGQIALANADEATNNVMPLPVSSLQDAGYMSVSDYTGETRTVRFFEVDSIGSGAFLVFENEGTGAPFTYVNNANPNATVSNFRFDQCEITYNPTIDSGANLTSIDALSMPMHFEHFLGTHPSMTKIGERRFYSSLESILGKFSAAMASTLKTLWLRQTAMK